MLTVGLTGGIGAGKSTVAELLVQRGAELIDADQIAREVVEPGGPAYQALVDRFGPGVLASDGTIDRPTLAQMVFHDAEALADLNGITHPAIGQEMLERRRAADSRDGVLLLAIPLLKTTHRETVGLDAVVVVDCPVPVAVERLVESRGMERSDAVARVASQISRDERLAEADYVVDNGDGLDLLQAEVDRLWNWLEERRQRAASSRTEGQGSPV